MIRASILGSIHPFITSIGLTLTLTGCESSEAPDTDMPPAIEARGDLISSEEILSLTRAELQALVTQIGLPELGEPQTGIHFHRLVYRTVDLDGQLSSASGMVVVPDGPGPFPMLSDQHGTQTRRRPTVTDPLRETELGGVALLFASQGWMVASADYLGLGVSQGLHPYYHADSAASATLDYLRSVRQFTDAQDIPLTDELFLTGYSQGAHVTMALHRALEQEPTRDWNLIASAPMAGAFDLADLSFPAALTAPAPSSALYVAYILLAFDRVHDIFSAPAEVFQAPHDAQVEALFDGTRDLPQILAALPATPAELLQPSFIASYLEDEDHPLRALFRANEVLDWSPRAPITLFHGRADVDVPFANAEHALERLRARGATVELVNVGDELDHATASMPSYLGARRWFELLRAAP